VQQGVVLCDATRLLLASQERFVAGTWVRGTDWACANCELTVETQDGVDKPPEQANSILYCEIEDYQDVLRYVGSPKELQGYKVLVKRPVLPSFGTQEFTSCLLPLNHGGVIYEIGKPAYPGKGNGGLLVFDTIHNAQSFIRCTFGFYPTGDTCLMFPAAREVWIAPCSFTTSSDLLVWRSWQDTAGKQETRRQKLVSLPTGTSIAGSVVISTPRIWTWVNDRKEVTYRIKEPNET